MLLGLTAIAMMLGYSRVVQPAFDHLQIERREVAEQDALLARERALLAAVPILPDAQRNLKQVLAAESSRLFVGDSVAATAELEAYAAAIATSWGVRLTSAEGRTPRTDHGVTRLLIDVRGDGSWRQVLDFVKALESGAQLVDISNIRIERGARAGPLGGPLVSVSATLAGYARADR